MEALNFYSFSIFPQPRIIAFTQSLIHSNKILILTFVN